MHINKRNLLHIAIQKLELEIASFREVVKREEGAMQDASSARDTWSDTTRSQKESLVGVLQKQYNEISKALNALKQIKIMSSEKIGIGALVELEEDKKRILYLILPGTRMKLEVDNIAVELISSASPTAQALYDHKEGETVKIKVPAGIRTLKILRVQ